MSCFKPGLEGDASAAGAASRLAGTGEGVRASASVGAGTVTGTGAGGYGLSGSKVPLARKTAAPAQSARTKTHNCPAKDMRSRDWEAKLTGITIRGRKRAFLCFSLDAFLSTRVDLNWPVLGFAGRSRRRLDY